MRCHIILVCKHRKNLMIQYGEFVKENMLSISQKYDFEILEIEVDKNHIYLLAKSEPKVSLLMMRMHITTMVMLCIMKEKFIGI